MDREIGAEVRQQVEGMPLERAPEAQRPDPGQPPSRERESIENRGYRYQISPAEIGTMLQIGRFRTVATDDLARFLYRGNTDDMRNDLGALRAQGLIQQRTIWTGAKGQKVDIVVLTKTGLEILKARGRSGSTGKLYAGLVKVREVQHDAAIYRMYQAEAARIERAGGKVKGIVLDYELKQNVYKPLAKIRPKASAGDYARAQAEIAAQNNLKVVHGKILLPDLRIEYKDREGGSSHVDLELATHHYRGAHMRGKAEAGFKMYAPQGSAAGLAAYDPKHMAEIFSF